MSDNIPFDIQVEIVKKLPIKSLIQFRSVSKPWKSLIDSSKFMTEYQQNTWLQHHILVGDDSEGNYVSFVDNDTIPPKKVSLTVPKSVHRNKIVGSSQGLFCFYTYGYLSYCLEKVILWNPTIRKSVDVVLPEAFLDEPFYTTVVGFGVCPRTLDPMLVKITTETDCRLENMNATCTLVEVFRLSLGAWKSLCVDLPRGCIRVSQENQVVIDKFIYWRAVDRISLILSFDMISEKFAEIRLPDSFPTSFFIWKLKESLVVIKEIHNIYYCPNFGVWMMDNGNPKSFKNIYTIKINILGKRVTRVLEFNRNGEAIVGMINEFAEKGARYELFVYEPNSQHVNRLGISSKRFPFFVSSYKETLLLLDH